MLVLRTGVEPVSAVPETAVLSIERPKHVYAAEKRVSVLNYTTRGKIDKRKVVYIRVFSPLKETCGFGHDIQKNAEIDATNKISRADSEDGANQYICDKMHVEI